MKSKLNNKGFSLIELIVAIGVLVVVMSEVSVLMYNCSKLYMNGSKETDIQNEAQRVTTIIEELLVDADKEVSFNTIDSKTDKLIVKKVEPELGNVERTYELYIKTSTWKSDSLGGHGDLYIDNGSGEQLLAKNVGMFKVNMDDYQNANKVNVTFNFNDGQYIYGSQGTGTGGMTGAFSKDFYIRNELAATGVPSTPEISDNDIDLDLLRFQVANLNDVTSAKKSKFGLSSTDSFSFNMDGSAVPGSSIIQSTNNRLFLNTGSNELYLADSVNMDFDYETNGTDPDHEKITITASFGGSDCFKVIVGVSKVTIGLSASDNSTDNNLWGSTYTTEVSGARRTGELICYSANNNDATTCVTPLANITGIDVSKATGDGGGPVVCDCFFETYDHINTPHNLISLNEGTSMQINLNNMVNGVPVASGGNLSCYSGYKFDGFSFMIKPYDNALAFQTKLFGNDGHGIDDDLVNIYTNGRFVCRVKMYFANTSGATATLTCRGYLLPMGHLNVATTKNIPGVFFDKLKEKSN